MYCDLKTQSLVGKHGALDVIDGDEVTVKLAMLIEGECGSGGIDRAAAKFGFSRQRYFQLRTLFLEKGGQALLSTKRGPKSNYRRTQELVCQVIRHRFLDPEASTEVIAQKLRQCNFRISKRTVDRVISQFGLQKKTLSASSPTPARGTGELPNPAKKPLRKSQSSQRRTRRSPTTGG